MKTASVKQWLKQEKDLEQKYGSNIIFHIHPMTVDLNTEKVQLGPKMGVVLLAGKGGSVTGTHTVQKVMDLVRKMMEAQEIPILRDEQICFMLNGSPMHPDTLFFADHRIQLPCWVQVGILKGPSL